MLKAPTKKLEHQGMIVTRWFMLLYVKFSLACACTCNVRQNRVVVVFIVPVNHSINLNSAVHTTNLQLDLIMPSDLLCLVQLYVDRDSSRLLQKSDVSFGIVTCTKRNLQVFSMQYF